MFCRRPVTPAQPGHPRGSARRDPIITGVLPAPLLGEGVQRCGGRLWTPGDITKAQAADRFPTLNEHRSAPMTTGKVLLTLPR
jgi:hypothetical protein